MGQNGEIMKCSLCTKVKKLPHYLVPKSRRTPENKVHRICHGCYKQQIFNPVKNRIYVRRYRKSHPEAEILRKEAFYRTKVGRLRNMYLSCLKTATQLEIPIVSWKAFRHWGLKSTDYLFHFKWWTENKNVQAANFIIMLGDVSEGYVPDNIAFFVNEETKAYLTSIRADIRSRKNEKVA
jgi:hypothetical protein